MDFIGIVFLILKMTKKWIIKFYKNAIINKSQVEIRQSNIDQAKEFLKKNPNCKSQILSDNQVMFIYPIEQTQK